MFSICNSAIVANYHFWRSSGMEISNNHDNKYNGTQRHLKYEKMFWHIENNICTIFYFIWSFSGFIYFTQFFSTITTSSHFPRSWIIFLQSFTPILFKYFSTASIHLFLGCPRGLLPVGFHDRTVFTILSSLPCIM